MRVWEDVRVRVSGVLLLLTVTALSSYNAVTTDRFAWDLSISRWAQKVNVSESLEEMLFFMGVLGLGGAAMVLAWLLLWLNGHRGEAILLFFGLLPNGLLFLVRDLFDRPRPAADLINVVGGPQGASYPSGHGFMVLFVYGFLLFLLARHSQSKRLFFTASVVVALYVPFAGLWLVNHGRHWLSDVFGGYLYGALCLLLWIALHRAVTAWEIRHPDTFTLATVQRIFCRLGLTRGV